MGCGRYLHRQSESHRSRKKEQTDFHIPHREILYDLSLKQKVSITPFQN